MKRLGQGETGVADLKVNNNIISEGKEKAEALNAQFVSVFTKEDKEGIPTMSEGTIPKILDLVISEEGVLKQLQGLSPNKAAGPDELLPWFLRMFAEKLAPILTDIFQSSINMGTLPHQWREANICGIFKKGDKSLPENYRPVSLTSVTCKILRAHHTLACYVWIILNVLTYLWMPSTVSELRDQLKLSSS